MSPDNGWAELSNAKKRKYAINIGTLTTGENMPGTDEWNTKQEEIQQDFLRALTIEAVHQIPSSEHLTDPDNIKIDKLINLYNRYYLPKKNKYNSRGVFLAIQTDKETPEDHWEKLFAFQKERHFPELSNELLLSKFTTSITKKILWDKLMKEKNLNVPKVFEQIPQNTFDRKNEQNTIPEALISNREKDLKEEPIHKITYRRQYQTRSK